MQSSFLAMGIFLSPMIAGKEPRHQDKLTLILLGAPIVVPAILFGNRKKRLRKAQRLLIWLKITNR